MAFYLLASHPSCKRCAREVWVQSRKEGPLDSALRAEPSGIRFVGGTKTIPCLDNGGSNFRVPKGAHLHSRVLPLTHTSNMLPRAPPPLDNRHPQPRRKRD